MLRKGWTLGSPQLTAGMHLVIRLFHSQQVRMLADFWSKSRPDLVVSLVPNFNRALCESLRQALPGVPFVTIITDIADYPPHFWFERQVQHVICGSDKAVAQAAELGHAPAMVHRVSGMILNPRFYELAPLTPEARKEARAALGLDPDRPVGLVLFGGQGAAVMVDIANRLQDHQLMLICGHNQKLRVKLGAMPHRAPMFVEGFTREVPRYMQLADYFIGKPGPASISEAVSMRLPVVGTAFPFWVPDPGGSGYVELPYTLVQDFTLFVLFREPNTDIWKRKLDWIAEHGGMALLTTHPDYMSFDGKPARDEYLVSRYEEFLSYAREKYDGLFWSATPREVARYYRAAVPAASRNTRQRVCMLAYSNYETDGRVRRYAETLARRGDHVDVIALSDGTGQLGESTINGVAVHRIQRRELDERNKWAYALRHLRFLLTSTALLTRCQREVRYDLVHVHNMPDFLVFAAWRAKAAGAKLILDIHDIVPELFANKFGAHKNRLYIWLLKVIEKLSAAFVDHVIVSNHLWRPKLIARSVPENKCSVFVNNVDQSIFSPHFRTRSDDKIVITFPGSFQWHQGLDIAIEAIAKVRTKVPNVELHLYGNGRLEGDLRALAARLGLNGAVRFFASVPLDQMPQVMANADLGVVPKRADGFGDEAYSTKIMEFMSQGVPVIASRTKIDTYYFDDTVVRFFPSGDVQGLADAMLELIGRKDLRDSLSAHGKEYAAHNSWDVRKQDYFDLVDSLTAR